MVQLQKDIKALDGAKIQVVAISYDAVDVLKKFNDDNKITFTLLSDPDSKVIEAFHIRNAQATGRQAGIPHPATFVVGTDGIIKAKLPGTVRERHTSEQLIEAVRKLSK